MNRDGEGDIRPMGKRNRSIGKDHITLEISFTLLHQVLSQERLTADPTTNQKRKALPFEVFKFAYPLLGGQFCFIMLFGKIAMRATQVTAMRDIYPHQRPGRYSFETYFDIIRDGPSIRRIALQSRSLPRRLSNARRSRFYQNVPECSAASSGSVTELF